MKTFKQFLTEEEQRSVVQFLRDNCEQAVHDFIQADKVLWRGTNKKENLLFADEQDVKNIRGFIDAAREDRRPKNTPSWAHDYINDFFKDKFGEPLRSSTLFCTTRRESTFTYGSSFVIFPIGSYTIYWSPKVSDLTIALFPHIVSDVAGDEKYWKPKGIDVEDVTQKMELEYIQEFLDEAGYRKGPNVNALRTSNELMVKCKRYLALNVGQKDALKLCYAAASTEKVEQ